MARAALGWSTHELADRAGLSRVTVVRFEDGGAVALKTVDSIETAFEREGLSFAEQADRVTVSAPL